MLQIGLNPYGLTYYVGLQGQGTPRANSAGRGLDGFFEIGEEIGARTLEIHNAWIAALDASGAARVRERLQQSAMTAVISLGPPLEGVESAIDSAVRLGATVIRLGLSPVLAGDRAECGGGWAGYVEHARRTLRRFAPVAGGVGLRLAIENHQDFGSEELLDFCEEAGPNVGVCLDTGNAAAVGEDPVAFARRVAPKVVHVHLKDYNAQWTGEGYRLVRCAIGDGYVPFGEIERILAGHHASLTASLEPGALNARHIRLFRPEWWVGYPPRSAAELGPCLAAVRVNRLADDADWRTPWEREDPPERIVEYELAMIRRSAANMRALGWMENQCNSNSAAK